MQEKTIAEYAEIDVCRAYSALTGKKKYRKYSRDEVLEEHREELEEELNIITNYVKNYIVNSTEKKSKLNNLTIKISGRLTRALANVRTRTKIIKFNPAIFSLDLSEIVNTVLHELAHIQLNKGDDEQEFINFCRESGIDLAYHTEKSIATSYETYCNNCQKVIAIRYKRSKAVKSIQNEEKTYICKKCKNTNLEIRIESPELS